MSNRRKADPEGWLWGAVLATVAFCVTCGFVLHAMGCSHQ